MISAFIVLMICSSFVLWQPRPLSIMRWHRPLLQKPENQVIVLPEDREDNLHPVGTKLRVLVISWADCRCSLVTAFHLNRLNVRDIGEVEKWSSTDLSEAEDETSQKLFDRFFGPLVRDAPTTAQVSS